jgi:hypothetical protein
MKTKNALNDEQKQLFRQTVEDYVTLLNMRDWRVNVSDKPATKGCMADCQTSLEDRLVVIRIGADWGNENVTNQMVTETAVHELLHAFLAPLLAAAQARDMATMQSAEHSVITVLERLLT